MNLFNVDLKELFDVLIRALLSLITLFLVTKMLGKKQVSQMSLFDYVIGISIGNFAAEMTINLESQEINGIFAVVIFGFVAYLISILTMKSIRMRRYFIGTPSIIINKGKFNENNLRKYKMDINDVLEQCRLNGYFDISQIEYAILEASGELSILPKTDYRPVNLTDMKLKIPKEGLCANVIIDGKIMYDNLQLIKKDNQWLLQQLKIKGYTSFSNILLSTVDINEKVMIYNKSINDKEHDFLE